MGRINKSKINLKAFNEWMKALDRKVSIKIGIIGENANQKAGGTDLTNAELGAIHEFGATITVTDKMRNYLHSQGIHLKKNTTTVVIPTRSFLRMPLLSSEGKKELMNVVKSEIDNKFKASDLSSSTANKTLDDAIHLIAETAYLRVLQAFESGGFGKWAPISEFTKQHRKNNKGSPPLTYTGQLRRSISYAINNKQWAKPPYGDLK